MHLVTSLSWVSLDANSTVPIHVQMEEQMLHAVGRGRLVPGQRLPALRDLARQLAIHPNTAARVYAALVREGVLASHPGKGTFVAARRSPGLREEQEARLGSIVGRALVEASSLGFSPEETEAAFSLHIARWREESRSPSTRRHTASTRPGRTLVVMGSHDLALDLLATQVRRLAHLNMTSVNVGSLGGLMALARGEAQVAGCHLLDGDSGEYNVPFMKRVLVGTPAVAVSLVGRVQGLLVPKGNPRNLRRLKDLARPGIRVMNRQSGSGTRVLFDYLLRKARVDPHALTLCDTEADTHTAVAAAVASGQADAGLGIQAAARAMGLDFVPLHNERYDLVVPRVHWDSRSVVALRTAMASQDFKDSVRELGGYDTSQTGSVVAELAG